MLMLGMNSLSIKKPLTINMCLLNKFSILRNKSVVDCTYTGKRAIVAWDIYIVPANWVSVKSYATILHNKLCRQLLARVLS